MKKIFLCLVLLMTMLLTCSVAMAEGELPAGITPATISINF